MQDAGKILVASQLYPPDSSTTAAYIAAIAETLAADNPVVVQLIYFRIFLNSAALQKLAIRADTVDPPGGKIATPK